MAIQFQQLQNSQEPPTILDMKTVKPLLTNCSFICLITCIYTYIGTIIKQAYETNFGTAYETYKQVVTEHPSIRLQDVKNYPNKRDDVQVKYKPRGSNSLVSLAAKFEYEIDIMDALARYGVSVSCGC